MKRRILCTLLIIAFFGMDASAQYKRKTGKYSIGAGAFFVDLGYVSAGYGTTNLHAVGAGYDFMLKGIKASDSQWKGLQYNARLGYFFRNNWAISAGVDHTKYIMRDSVTALLSGTVNPGIDNQWSGNYTNEEAVMSSDHFFYGNRKGQYYIHADAIYSIYLVRTNKFAMPLYAGLGTGMLLSVNEFNFAGRHDLATRSVSGYGINAQLGLRLEFLNHFFLQVQTDGGFMHQLKVANRPNIPSSVTNHYYLYGALKLNLGFNFYFRPKNACDSCPKW